MKTVSTSDANRHFSRVIRQVAEGEEFIVVSRGRPVATIGPVSGDDKRREAARAALLQRLQEQTVTGNRAWTRESLYEDDQDSV